MVLGYGQTGPYRTRPGYDVMIEAEAGLMYITGEQDGPPVKVGVAVTGKAIDSSFLFFFSLLFSKVNVVFYQVADIADKNFIERFRFDDRTVCTWSHYGSGSRKVQNWTWSTY
jgi:hypothetical protein